MRFRQAWAHNGYTADDLPFKSLFYPWNAYFGLFFNVFLALVQGWTTLSPFSAGNFVDAYILLPVFFIIFFGYKFIFKTKFKRVQDMNVEVGRREDLETKEDEESILPVGEFEEPLTFGQKAKRQSKRFWKAF